MTPSATIASGVDCLQIPFSTCRTDLGQIELSTDKGYTSLKYNSDISGFGKYAVKNYLTLDEWQNANWLGNYKNCFFNVNVEFTLKSGSLFGES